MTDAPDDPRAEFLLAALAHLDPIGASVFTIEQSQTAAARATRDGDPGVWLEALGAGASWTMLEERTGHRRETMRPRIYRWLETRKLPKTPYALAALLSRPRALEDALHNDAAFGFTRAEVDRAARDLRERIYRAADVADPRADTA